ncbi:MAG: putative deacylase, partial [Planctomycetota bacterium]
DGLTSEMSDKERKFLTGTESQLEQQSEAGETKQRSNYLDTGSQDDGLIFKPLSLLGKTIQPGKIVRLHWVASETLYGSQLDTPVHVIRGEKAGITLCLTAAVHGDELNGVEIIRQIVNDISPSELSGTLIGVPIVNLFGFTRGTRYLPDRRDLNRFFPGNPNGSAASRIGYSFFEEIIRHCDRLVDFHTGSMNRTNMPQLRANLQVPEIMEFTRKFGSTAVLHSRKLKGNLRTAATNAGIPAVALELGEPGSLQKKHIKDGVKIVRTLLSKLDMIKHHRGRSEPQPLYYSSRWVRVNNGGLLITEVKLGERIRKGTILGTLINPLSNETFEVVSPYSGRLLGMALNQFMLPGYAAFNIGLVEDEATIIVDRQSIECSGMEMDPEENSEEIDCASEDGEEMGHSEAQLDDLTGTEESELH